MKMKRCKICLQEFIFVNKKRICKKCENEKNQSKKLQKKIL